MTCEFAGDVLAIAPRHRIKKKAHTNNNKKMDFITITSCFSSKDTINEMRRYPQIGHDLTNM